MTVYIGLAVFILLLYILSNATTNEHHKKLFWWLGCLAMLLVIGLRSYHTGSDTIQYVRQFISLQTTEWDLVRPTKDYGYTYYVKLVSEFTDSPTIFLLITGFLSCIGIWDLIQRNSSKPLLALFFYITIGNFFFILTGMRQAIAMSFCMLALRYVQERKLIPFAFWILLAAQFHHSAYIFAVMYVLGVRKVNFVSMAINIGVTVAAYFSYESLLNVVNEVLDYNYGVEELDNGGVFFAVLLVIVALALYTKKIWMKDRHTTVIMNSGIICAIIWVFRLIGRTAERPSMYWLNTIPVLLTESIDSFENKNDRFLIEMGAIVLTFLLFVRRVGSLDYAFCF